jgi:hypothetical protein
LGQRGAAAAFGKMAIRSNKLSVKRRSVSWCLGQMMFGQQPFQSKGVRSKNFQSIDFSVK